jgi:rubrerythrin
MAKLASVGAVLDLAIMREGEAHDFYRRLAGRVTRPDVRTAIEDFAADELRHRFRLEAIRAGETAFMDDEVGSLNLADTVPEVQPHPDMSYIELLIIAMNKEKAAFRIYTNLASIARTKECRDTLLKLAQEEARHKLRLEIEYDLASF